MPNRPVTQSAEAVGYSAWLGWTNDLMPGVLGSRYEISDACPLAECVFGNKSFKSTFRVRRQLVGSVNANDGIRRRVNSDFVKARILLDSQTKGGGDLSCVRDVRARPEFVTEDQRTNQ